MVPLLLLSIAMWSNVGTVTSRTATSTLQIKSNLLQGLSQGRNWWIDVTTAVVATVGTAGSIQIGIPALWFFRFL